MKKNNGRRVAAADKYATMIVNGATAKSPAQLQASLNRGASGAAGAHDHRPRRVRTRATAKAAALKEW